MLILCFSSASAFFLKLAFQSFLLEIQIKLLLGFILLLLCFVHEININVSFSISLLTAVNLIFLILSLPKKRSQDGP